MRAILYAALILPLVSGCVRKETSLSGTVLIDGIPLKDGYITFFPPEGSVASMVGAKVTDGHYEIKPMPTGERRAVTSATPEVKVHQNGSGPALLRFMPTAQTISPQIQGNSKTVRIARGAQTLDFELTNPRPPGGR